LVKHQYLSTLPIFSIQPSIINFNQQKVTPYGFLNDERLGISPPLQGCHSNDSPAIPKTITTSRSPRLIWVGGLMQQVLGIVSDTTTPLTSTRNTKVCWAYRQCLLAKLGRSTARVILSHQALADGICAPVLPQYFENLASERFLQSLHW
jgi:hypothetical protein